MIRHYLIGAGLLLAAASASGADYPFVYAGRVTGAGGAPVTGKTDFVVRFFDASTGGSALGQPLNVPGIDLGLDGVFQIDLQLAPPAFHQIFARPDLPVYIEVTDLTHRPDQPLPRQRFNVVPFAAKVPVDGATITYDANGALTVPPVPAVGAAGATQSGYLSTGDWVQFNGAPEKTYVDGLYAAQVASVAGLSTSLAATSANLTTTNTNLTAVSNGALKKDGSVPLTGPWNVGAQDVTNAGNVTMVGGKVFGLSVGSSDPANLTAGDVGKIWYNGGIRLWNGTSAQSLGISGAGVQSLNGLNANAQSLANGATGTAPAWVSSSSTHTLNIPLANAGGVTQGLISNGEWVLFNGKQNALSAANAATNGYLAGGDWTLFNAKQPLLSQANLMTSGYLASGDWAQFNAKDPFVAAGTTAQYFRGDKSWQTLSTTNVTEGTNLYFTTARAQAAITAEAPLAAGTTIQYYRGDKTWQTLTTDVRSAVGASAPLSYSSTTGLVALAQATNAAPGYLSSADWALFNGKEGAVAAGATFQYYRGDKTWQTFAADARAAVSATAPLAYSSATGIVSLPPAAVSANGFLTSADWATFNAKASPVPNLSAVMALSDDFVTASTAGALGWSATTANSGTIIANGAGAVTAGHPGILSLSTSTTTNGYARSSLGSASVILGGGPITLEMVVRLTAVNAGSDVIRSFIGLSDAAGTNCLYPSNGVMFTYMPDIFSNQTSWTGWNFNASSGSGIGSVGGVAATTFQRLRIDINAAGTQATFSVNGVSLGSGSANMPVTALAPSFLVCKNGGTTQSDLQVDYFSLTQTFTTAR